MNDRNRTMSILTGIAIILVALGHLDWDILSFGGLFPYYSFHVLIFVFVSGYFYKTQDEDHIGSYFVRKLKHLILPYFIWNLFYGLVSTILAGKGFIFCNKITLYNYLAEPFLGGHQYGLNFASWFVPALFMVEMVNILMRKVFRLIHLYHEWLMFSLCLAVGIAVVCLAQNGHIWGYYKTPGRILFMLPAFQLGRFYRAYLEEKDTVPSYIYFPVLLTLQLIIIMLTGGSVNYSAVWCTSFASFAAVPYITTITGIAFWLRISKILAEHEMGNALLTVGNSSFSIMMNHVTCFFCINLVTMFICSRIDAVIPFDIAEFKENINYVYCPDGIGAWKAVYLAAGIFVPVALNKLFCGIKKHDLFHFK